MSTISTGQTLSPIPRRLVVRGVNWIGDAVMTTPALLRLREALPGAHITLLTHEKLAGLWPGHPAVDKVMTFAAKEGVFSVARRLRERQFDTALVLPNSLRTGLEVWLAGIPRRIGYAGGGRGWLLTQAVPWRTGVTRMRKRTPAEIRQLVSGPVPAGLATGAPSAESHHLHHYLHLVAAMGAKPEALAPVIAVADAEVAAVKAKFNLPEGLLIGLNAGAEYGPAKRWPTDRFIAVAKELRVRLGCGFVVFGRPEEVTLVDGLLAALGPEDRHCVTNLAGKTSLRELCAALRACRVVVTNDTGPMHVAAAVGTRLVGLFGSTSIELTGPGLPGDARHTLLHGEAACAPCFLRECPIDFRCMKSLGTAQVVEAVIRATV